MPELLKTAFNAVAKEGLISSVDVERIVRGYGLPFTRRTLKKWAVLGVIDRPEELNGSYGTGRRTGYTFEALVKVLALRLTLGRITGLGKGSRLRRRFKAIALAVKYAEENGHDMKKVASGTNLEFMQLASRALSPNIALIKPSKYEKIIRLVALIYCFYYRLLLDGSNINLCDSIETLRKAAVFSSINEETGIKEGYLERVPLDGDTVAALEELLTNISNVIHSGGGPELKAWAKVVRFFDTNGWLAALATSALKNKGHTKSFSSNAKANWLVAVSLECK